MTPVAGVLDALRARGLTLAVAEGDTGGLLLEWLTAVPGSSAVVLGGIVAYHDRLKQQLLGVANDLLEKHGSVSAEVAEAMARGVRDVAGADVGVALTGIAGPGGATATKPVGLAWVAVADHDGSVARGHQWHADRDGNRAASAHAALVLVLERVSKK